MNDHSAHTPNEPSPGDGGPSEEPHDDQEPAREFFLPNRMLMHVELPAGVAEINFAELSGSIDRNLNEKLGFEEGLIKKVQPRNILTLQRRVNPGPAFSIVPIELDRKADLVQILLDLDKKLRTSGTVDLGQGATWQAISPNWLLGSAGHGGSIPPSPGSWPLAKSARREKDWKFGLVESDPNNPRDLPFAIEQGAGVHVAILDTAPSFTDLDEAYETWHLENELIDRLLKPEPHRKLRLVTDIYAEIELMDCSLARHRYWMADHGLFIAGEIESIAPEATIHLIKVFTSYGSASILTLAQGLIRVLDDEEIGRPLIVNCSFGLAMPVPGHDDQDFPVELRNSPANPDIEERMQTSLRALFDELTNQSEVIVVAAAGDDTQGTSRAPARLPAAYDSVIGVGALPKGFPLENGNFKPASYSNLADNPPNTGFVTLGGEAGRRNGILGIFTSETPYYLARPEETHEENSLPPDPKEPTRHRLRYNTHNKKGSAEWAGASFAAPIITGILANWCSQQIGTGMPINLANARQALIDKSQSTTTAEGEHVILVTQG